MSSFTKKGKLQKIIISILIVLGLTNILTPSYSQADFGGVLFSPVVDLICSLGDAILNTLQVCMTGEFGSDNLDFSLNMLLVEDDEFFKDGEYEDYKTTKEASKSNTINVDDEFDKGWFGRSNKYHIPLITYSPEQIFAGNVSGLDINFINPNKYDAGESSAAKLQPTIAKWYVALRNLALVGLLSVLVYVGIRIMISSTASDKAKYKQMLVDWLVALCLLFFLHYIMSFIVTMTESICTAIGGDGKTTIVVETKSEDNEEGKFTTNLLGLARFKTQYKDFGKKVTYLVMYIAMIVYTFIFTWFYLKRLLMMAFLTLMAPVVALTYPIDKMNDGKAQAFDMWLKEYVFNALIQPFHLVVYTIFIASAMDLAETNIIYSIATMGFILAAEKILRKFFGFEKAGAGTLGALGAISLGSVANKLLSGKGGGGGSSSQNAKSSGETEKAPRFERKHDISSIEGGNNDIRESNDQETSSNHNLDSQYHGSLSEDEKNEMDSLRNELDNADYNDMYLNSDYYEQKQSRLAELEKKNQGDNSNNNSTNKNEAEQQPKDGKLAKFGRGVTNLARAHNIDLRPKTVGKAVGKTVGKGAVKAIKGTAKFATRTTFGAAAGALPAAIAVASGGGFAGASAAFSAAFMAGANLGDRAANKVINGVSNMPNAVRREVDIFNGNTNMQDAASRRQFMKDKNNRQYVKDMMTQEAGGVIPSATAVTQRMNGLNPYLEEGLTDIKDMLKAQKAEQYGINSKQSAIIAAVGKEKGITSDILNDEKKVKAQQLNLKQEFINKGNSEQQADKLADHTINVLKAQNGIAHNLKKVETNAGSSTKASVNTKERASMQPTNTRTASGSSNTRTAKNTASGTTNRLNRGKNK